MNDEDFKRYIAYEAERRYGPRTPVYVRRNAFIGELSDPLRGEFLGMLDDEYRKDMRVLFRRCNRDVDHAKDCLKLLGLYSPWLMQVMTAWWQNDNPKSPISWWLPRFPPRVSHTEKYISMLIAEVEKGVLDANEVLSVARRLYEKQKYWAIPVEQVPGPRPWDETKGSFLERCEAAWDKNKRWVEARGLKEAEKRTRLGKGAKTDQWPKYIRAFLRNRLRGETYEKLAEGLKIERRTLTERFSELEKRLQFSAK